MGSFRDNPAGSIPLNRSVLTDDMKEYKSPAGRVAHLLRKGELIHLRRDLYLASALDDITPYSCELIANHLYSPSYVSFESVLAAEGLIPERVVEVRSACMGRSRVFTNATGRYRYTHLPQPYFSVGTRVMCTELDTCYLAATPEKALCDLIVTTPHLRLQSLRALSIYLEEDLRLDAELFAQLRPDIIRECAATAHKKRSILQLLAQLL